MSRYLILFAILGANGAAAGYAQTAPLPPMSDGLPLLTRVAKHYSEAKTYTLAAVEERASTTEYSRSWRKTILTASEMAGDRYHFEGRSDVGDSLQVADGKTVWTFRVAEHRYTVRAETAGAPTGQQMVGLEEMAMLQAKDLRKTLGGLAKPLKAASRLPDATLLVDGRSVLCDVVRFQNTDEKRTSPQFTFVETIWIDKGQETILKMVQTIHTSSRQSGSMTVPMDQEVTTTFHIAELNGTAHEDLFTFTPPADARLVQNFPDPSKNFGWPDLTGERAPSLKLKGADGTVVALESFRGKPVLLDFWATWCAPCVAALPQLAAIDREAKGKGLVLLGIDQDEEAKTAADFLRMKGYAWRDFHDGDGEIERLVGTTGVPRTVLIDARGNVTYDATGMNEDELRTAIARLGPEYAGLAPKPKGAAACVASK